MNTQNVDVLNTRCGCAVNTQNGETLTEHSHLSDASPLYVLYAHPFLSVIEKHGYALNTHREVWHPLNDRREMWLRDVVVCFKHS